MSEPARALYTVEEYLALDRESEHKRELANGEIVAMAGGSPEHNAVVLAATIALSTRLAGGPCEPHISDQRVRLDETGLYAYPDLTVSCGPPEFSDENPPSLLNPSVIFEVLSPSTESYDRGTKALHYRHRASVHTIVLLSTDAVRAEVYRRIEGDRWMIETIGEGGALAIPPLEVEFPLDELYVTWRRRRAD